VKNKMGCSGHLQREMQARQNWKEKGVPVILWLPFAFIVLIWIFMLGIAMIVKGDNKR